VLDNLDMTDPKETRWCFSILEDMGAKVKVEGKSVRIKVVNLWKGDRHECDT